MRIKAYVPGEVQSPASPGIAGCDLVQDERVHEVQIPVGRHGSARNAVGPVEGESRLAVGYACAQGFQLPDAVLGAKDDILQAGLQTGLSEARVIAADSGLNGQDAVHVLMMDDVHIKQGRVARFWNFPVAVVLIVFSRLHGIDRKRQGEAHKGQDEGEQKTSVHQKSARIPPGSPGGGSAASVSYFG